MYKPDPISVRLLTGEETCRESQCKVKDAESGCLCAIAANKIERLLTEVALLKARLASAEASSGNVVRLDAERERRLSGDRTPEHPSR